MPDKEALVGALRKTTAPPQVNQCMKGDRRSWGLTAPGESQSLQMQRNAVWQMYFVIDAPWHDRRIEVLAIIDDCHRGAIELVADFGDSRISHKPRLNFRREGT
jgi:hypothetical protein